MSKLKDAIICDIDGTLANIDHRRQKLFQDRDFKAFNDSMKDDTPNEWCVFLIESIKTANYNYKDFEVIYVSGREECYREITEYQIIRWITHTPVGFKLFMRPTKDNRPDTEIKTEIYNNHIKDKYNVKFVLDDRQKVVDMWRNRGLVCLQCDVGDF